MKAILTVAVLIVMMAMAGIAVADVQEDWPLGTPNTHTGQHVLIDFEEGVKSFDPIVCPIPGINFVTIGGDTWVYACNDGQLNLRNETSGTGGYVINGYAGAWCGQSGNGGKVTFDYPVSHVSCLSSTNSGLIMVAYDNNDNEITNSSWANPNYGDYNFTRLSVDRDECDISYVIIHDNGNYWLIDDIVVSRITTFVIGDVFNNDTEPIMVRWAENVGSCNVMLTYDESIANVTAVGNGDMDSTFSNLENAGDGWIRVGAYQTDNPGLDGEFILANVTFSPVGDGVCPLNITVTTFKDATLTGVPMEYKVINGTYSSYSNGDVNGDGVVDMFDAMYLAKHVIGMSVFSDIIEVTADVNGDGIIDIDDAKYLAKHIIGIDGYEELK